MRFSFPIVIIDEDYRSENTSGTGIRALASALEEEGMDVVGFDPALSIEAAWRLPNQVQRMENLHSLLARADYVTLHVPALDATAILGPVPLEAGGVRALVRFDYAHGRAVAETLRAAVVSRADDEQAGPRRLQVHGAAALPRGRDPHQRHPVTGIGLGQAQVDRRPGLQAEILDLLNGLVERDGMSLVFITHDLAVVSEVAQRVAVMYAGEVIEQSGVPAIFERPQHPYTRALLQAIPDFTEAGSRLSSLPGIVPGQYDRPAGCLLAPRCPMAFARCHAERPVYAGTHERGVRCFTPLNREEGA